MTNVQLVKATNHAGVSMIQDAVWREGKNNVLVITDNIDLQKSLESKNVKVELIKSIDNGATSELYEKYKHMAVIYITTPKIITRYLNETVNVKFNKAVDIFMGYESKVYILSDYPSVSSIVSNSSKTDGRHEQLSSTAKARAVRAIKK